MECHEDLNRILLYLFIILWPELYNGIHLLCYVFFFLPDQRFLFLSGKFLNLYLPAHGFLPGIIFLLINQLYRGTNPGIFSAFSFIMGLQPFLNIICPSCVQGSVTAPQDISNILLFCHKNTHTSLCKETAGSLLYAKQQQKQVPLLCSDIVIINSGFHGKKILLRIVYTDNLWKKYFFVPVSFSVLFRSNIV